MKKFTLLSFLLINSLLFSQSYVFFDPDNFNEDDFIIHFKGTTGKFMRYDFEHKEYGKINWRKNVYLENGHPVKITYTDTNNRLKSSTFVYSGYSVRLFNYLDDHTLEVSYWDQDLNPINISYVPVHKMIFKYDESKRVISLKSYNENGDFICDIHYNYVGDSERINELSYHKENGDLYQISIAKVQCLYKKDKFIGRSFTSNNGQLPEDGVKSIRIKRKNKKVVVFGNESTRFSIYSIYNENGKLIQKMNVIKFSESKEKVLEHIMRFQNPNKWISE